MASIFRQLIYGVLLASVAGCSAFMRPDNQSISAVDEDSGYRRLQEGVLQSTGDSLIMLAFSGGGTRAAAFSYGVMQELRDTLLDQGDTTIRLLDEVDSISSVSGGSFTAAYYGLYRDRLFEDYENDFLRLGVQQALIRRLLNPMHWIRSAFSGFDRTEMTIDYYDRMIFHGGTFDDMASQGRPYIDINATDITTGLRFTFTQERFDLICSDLGEYSVARAVTASSAVPVAFPTVVLENHAAKCDIAGSLEWQLLEKAEDAADTETQKELIIGLESYRDAAKRPYIHLVDGGISDNLGLRALSDRIESLSQEAVARLSKRPPKNILIVLVNAEVNRDQLIEQTARKPSASTTMSALTAVQMARENRETIDDMRRNLGIFSQQIADAGLGTQVYFTEVNFDLVHIKEVNRFLNSLPTSLQLEDIQVDRLIGAGRLLLRTEPEFMRFKQNNHARLHHEAASVEDICREFFTEGCPTNP